MNKDVVVRRYVEGEEEDVVRLLESGFVGWPKFDLQCSSLDHWRWKYLDNPLRISSVIVGLVDGNIVGCSHGLFSKVRVGGKTLLTQQGVDVAVQSDFRGMGIMREMIALKEKHQRELKTNLSYTLSSHPSVYRLDLERGLPQFPKPLRHYVKIRDLDLHLKTTNSENNQIIKYGYKTLRATKQIEKFLKQSPRGSKSSFEVQQIDRFSDEVGELWSQARSSYGFIVERDQGYLNWRYCDSRGGDYLVRQATEDGRILGFIVLRVNRLNREYPQGYIVDLLTLPNRFDVCDALIEGATDYFDGQGVNFVTAFAIRGHPFEGLFEKNGFLWDRVKYYLFCTPKNIGGEWEAFISTPSNRLHFMYGDLDWI